MTVFIAVLLALLTLGFIVYPFLRRGSQAAETATALQELPDAGLDAEIEARVRARRQAPARFCTRCGDRLKADDRFCQRCGQRVDQEAISD